MALLNIDNIVNINITVSEETGVNLGFNVGLIVGSSGHIAADTRIKRYASAADMLTDGFLVTDPEYLAAVMYFSQSPSPKAVYIGTMDGSEGSAETLMSAVEACWAINSDWYGLYVCDANESVISEIVKWAGDHKVCFFYNSSVAEALLAESKSDIFSVVHELGTNNSFGIYSTVNHAAAAVMGLAMGLNDGTDDSAFTLAYKTLKNVSVENLTSAQVAILKGMSQFLRRYRVLIMDKSGNTALDVSNLHCRFDVNKAMDETPNYSQIAVYNLSYDTEASIINSGKKVILEAGYENGNYGMIFSGDIVQPIRMKVDNVTRALVLICQDGDTYLNNSFTAMTIAAGATQNDVVKAVTGDQIQTGSITGSLPATKLARGKVLFGQSAGYLSQVARSADAQMYVEDGIVNIVAAADYDPSTAVELNPYTGLIGTPEQTDDGIACQCLINPRIKLNTRIYINSTLVQQKQVEEGSLEYNAVSSDGVYRVYKLTISGDTRGTDWYMSIDAITQSGEKPVGLTGNSTKLWR